MIEGGWERDMKVCLYVRMNSMVLGIDELNQRSQEEEKRPEEKGSIQGVSVGVEVVVHGRPYVYTTTLNYYSIRRSSRQFRDSI